MRTVHLSDIIHSQPMLVWLVSLKFYIREWGDRSGCLPLVYTQLSQNPYLGAVCPPSLVFLVSTATRVVVPAPFCDNADVDIGPHTRGSWKDRSSSTAALLYCCMYSILKCMYSILKCSRYVSRSDYAGWYDEYPKTYNPLEHYMRHFRDSR